MLNVDSRLKEDYSPPPRSVFECYIDTKISISKQAIFIKEFFYSFDGMAPHPGEESKEGHIYEMYF
jgi:hypothetical protein